MADMVQRQRSRRGSERPNANLTEADVQAIRLMLATGRFLVKDVAALFGVSRGAVTSIKGGNTWAWLKAG